MALSPRIKTSAFTDLKDLAFLSRIEDIISGVNSHPTVFVSPSPNIEYLRNAKNLFRQLYQEALNNGHNAINARQTQRSILTAKIFQLSCYVLTIASTKLTYEEKVQVIEYAHFTVAKSRSSIPVLHAPMELVAASSKFERQIDLKWKPIRRGLKNYIVERTDTDPYQPGAVWKRLGYPTAARFSDSGLNSLTYYWYRVRANSAKGESPNSEVIKGLSI